MPGFQAPNSAIKLQNLAIKPQNSALKPQNSAIEPLDEKQFMNVITQIERTQVRRQPAEEKDFPRQLMNANAHVVTGKVEEKLMNANAQANDTHVDMPSLADSDSDSDSNSDSDFENEQVMNTQGEQLGNWSTRDVRPNLVSSLHCMISEATEGELADDAWVKLVNNFASEMQDSFHRRGSQTEQEFAKDFIDDLFSCINVNADHVGDLRSYDSTSSQGAGVSRPLENMSSSFQGVMDKAKETLDNFMQSSLIKGVKVVSYLILGVIGILLLRLLYRVADEAGMLTRERIISVLEKGVKAAAAVAILFPVVEIFNSFAIGAIGFLNSPKQKQSAEGGNEKDVKSDSSSNQGKNNATRQGLAAVLSTFSATLIAVHCREKKLDAVSTVAAGVKAMKGLSGGFTTFLEALQFCSRALPLCIQEQLQHSPLFDSMEACSFPPKTLRILKECKGLVTRYNKEGSGMFTEGKASNLAIKLYSTLQDDNYFQIVNRNSFEYKIYADTVNKMEPIVTAARVSIQYTGSRPTPVAVWLWSDGSGYGKSYLAKYLTARVFDDQPLGNSLIYAKTATKHWDGYIGQKVVLYDDVLKPERDPDNVSNVECLLQYIGPNRFVVSKANVNDKGMLFDSDLIMACSNFSPSQVARATIQNASAFEQRFNRKIGFTYECKLKPGFIKADGKSADTTKIKAQSDKDKMSFAHAYFVKRLEGQEFIMTAEEVYQEVITGIALSKQHFENGQKIFQAAREKPKKVDVANPQMMKSNAASRDTYASRVRQSPKSVRKPHKSTSPKNKSQESKVPAIPKRRNLTITSYRKRSKAEFGADVSLWEEELLEMVKTRPTSDRNKRGKRAKVNFLKQEIEKLKLAEETEVKETKEITKPIQELSEATEGSEDSKSFTWEEVAEGSDLSDEEPSRSDLLELVESLEEKVSKLEESNESPQPIVEEKKKKVFKYSDLATLTMADFERGGSDDPILDMSSPYKAEVQAIVSCFFRRKVRSQTFGEILELFGYCDYKGGEQGKERALEKAVEVYALAKEDEEILYPPEDVDTLNPSWWLTGTIRSTALYKYSKWTLDKFRSLRDWLCGRVTEVITAINENEHVKSVKRFINDNIIDLTSCTLGNAVKLFAAGISIYGLYSMVSNGFGEEDFSLKRGFHKTLEPLYNKLAKGGDMLASVRPGIELNDENIAAFNGEEMQVNENSYKHSLYRVLTRVDRLTDRTLDKVINVLTSFRIEKRIPYGSVGDIVSEVNFASMHQEDDQAPTPWLAEGQPKGRAKDIRARGRVLYRDDVDFQSDEGLRRALCVDPEATIGCGYRMSSKIPNHKTRRMRKLAKNLCEVMWEEGKGYLKATFLTGTILLINRHFFYALVNGEQVMRKRGSVIKLKLIDREVPIEFPFNPDDLSDFSADSRISDLALYYVRTNFAKGLDVRPNIINYFVDEDKLKMLGTSYENATLIHSASSIKAVLGSNVGVTRLQTHHMPRGNTWLPEHVVEAAATYWNYDKCSDGDCGSLLLDDGKEPCILGMHAMERKHGLVGSERYSGAAIVLTKQILRSTFVEFEAKIGLCARVSDQQHNGVVLTGEPYDMPAGDFTPVGFVKQPAIGSTRSKLVPSMIADTKSKVVAQCVKTPAILSHEDERIAGEFKSQAAFLAHNCRKNAKTSKDFEPELAEACFEDMFAQYADADIKVPIRVLTEDETINGGGEFTHLRGMAMSKSAGYPFSNWHRAKGKKGFFTQNLETGKYDLTCERFKEHIENYETRLRGGERMPFIWTNFFKDELVSKKKIEEFRTRVICGSPLDLTYLTRKYFGSFISLFYATRNFTESSVGIDVFSKQWGHMIEKLYKKSDVGFDGDFRGFDTSMHSQFVHAFYKHVDKWYKDNDPNWTKEDSVVRFILCMELMNTLELVGNSLYRSHHGNPSGNVLTTVMNTMYAQWLIRMGYVSIMGTGKSDPAHRANDLGGLAGFRKNVGLEVYGDDHIVAVSRKASEFNALTFGKWLGEHDIGYTPAVKNTELSSVNRDIVSLTFLSCSTVVRKIANKLEYMPYVQMGSVAKCVKYVRPNGDPIGALRDNVNDSLARVWPSGRKRFTAVRKDLIDAMKHKRVPTDGIMTYGEGLLSWRDDTPVLIEDEVRFQMLGAESPLVASAQSDNAEQEVVPDSKNVRRGELVMGMKQSIRHICRRGHIVMHIPAQEFQQEVRIPVNGIYANDDLNYSTSEWRRSGLNWWAAPFRVRHDTPVFTFKGPATVDLVYRAHSRAGGNDDFDYGLMLGRDGGPGNTRIQTWSGPVDYGNSRSGVVMVKVPFTTYFNVLKLPKKGSDTGPNYSTGSLFALVDNTKDGDTPVTVYAQLGDNSRFGMLYAVPNIKVNATRISPDTYSEARFQMGQGISYQKNINIGTIADSTMDIGGADKFENGQSVDAKAGMDKHNIGTSYLAIQRRAYPMLSHGSNLTQSQLLAVEPGGTIGADPEVFGTNTDEMSIAHMTQLNYYKTLQVFTSAESGDVIASGFLTPAPNLFEASLGDTIQPPIIEYTSSKFSFWQGGLKYRFSVSKAQVATGRLAFVLLYGRTSVPSDLQNVMGQYAHVLDLTSDNLTFDVVAPYRSNFPRLNVPNGDVGPRLAYSMGMWALVVVNPIRTTTTAANSVYVNMFVGSDDDFKLSVYGQQNYTLVSNIASPSLDAKKVVVEEKKVKKKIKHKKRDKTRFQMMSGSDSVGATGVTFSETKAVQPMRENANAISDEKQSQSMIPEEQINFRTLAERPQLISTFTWSVSDNLYTELFSGRMPWDFILGSNVSPFNQFQYWRGSMEITVKVQATAFHTGTLIVYFVPLTSDSEIDAHHRINLPSQTIVQHQFLVASESNTVTLKIPFQQMAAWLNTSAVNIDCGGLRVAVFNPLIVGTGELLEAEVSLFASFPDSSFKILDPLAFPALPFRQMAN